uniref:Nucleotide-binding alpha-beta plait domain-containing protein n=1 Tax=Tanacetum cinerariifolium TaxID=118510 RepID=A0A699KE72_TANCI|nr:hypothetical protein [Tanacetum cinerariifolium]
MKTRDGMTGLSKAIKGKSTTFFFTRFPESWIVKNLWEMFKKYGTVVDLYLAYRRSINIGNTKLLINMAKYDKARQNILQNEKGDGHQSDWKWTFRNLGTKPQKEQNDWKWASGKKDSKSHFEHGNVKKSFKDAIVGTHGNEKKHNGMK